MSSSIGLVSLPSHYSGAQVLSYSKDGQIAVSTENGVYVLVKPKY